jgi:hypothetical protein
MAKFLNFPMNLTAKIGPFSQFCTIVVTFFFSMDALQLEIWPLQNKSFMKFCFNSTCSAHPGSVLKIEALVPYCNIPNHNYPGRAMLLHKMISFSSLTYYNIPIIKLSYAT